MIAPHESIILTMIRDFRLNWEERRGPLQAGQLDLQINIRETALDKCSMKRERSSPPPRWRRPKRAR